MFFCSVTRAKVRCSACKVCARLGGGGGGARAVALTMDNMPHATFEAIVMDHSSLKCPLFIIYPAERFRGLTNERIMLRAAFQALFFCLSLKHIST